MKSLRLYAIGRIAFGVASLAAPAVMGRMLAGPGGALPDAQAFLRGMGGREIGLGLGLLAAIRVGGPVRKWVVAGLLADAGDLAGIAGAWKQMPPAKRWVGVERRAPPRRQALVSWRACRGSDLGGVASVA